MTRTAKLCIFDLAFLHVIMNFICRTCEVSIHLLLAEQVLVQLQVIMILYVAEGLSLRLLL
jgi:hypothetical protein